MNIIVNSQNVVVDAVRIGTVTRNEAGQLARADLVYGDITLQAHEIADELLPTDYKPGKYLYQDDVFILNSLYEPPIMSQADAVLLTQRVSDLELLVLQLGGVI